MQPGLYHLIHIKLSLITIGFSKYFSATCQNFSNGKHKLTSAHQGIITISSGDYHHSLQENLFRAIQSNKAGALQQHHDLSPHFTVPKPGPVTRLSLSIPTSSNPIEMPRKALLVLISCKPTFSLLVALLHHPSCVAETKLQRTCWEHVPHHWYELCHLLSPLHLTLLSAMKTQHSQHEVCLGIRRNSAIAGPLLTHLHSLWFAALFPRIFLKFGHFLSDQEHALITPLSSVSHIHPIWNNAARRISLLSFWLHHLLF